MKKEAIDEIIKENNKRDNVFSELPVSLASMITDPHYFKSLVRISERQPFDHMIAETVSISDLDQTKVTEFFNIPRVQMQDDFCNPGSYVDWLNNFGFMREAHPTYGALLCFGRNPTQLAPGAFTRCTQWMGNNRHNGWLDAQDYRRDLITQFKSSHNFLQKHLGLTREIHRDGHFEKPEIPPVALGEVLANALVHREYANEMSPVYVDVFEDRVEISSPGLLPEPMTLDLLGEEHGSHPRNPQIARLFYLYGYVEEVGSGIQRMQHALARVGLQAAKFAYRKDETFVVTFYRPSQPATYVASDLSEGD